MLPHWAHRIAGVAASIDPRLLPEGAKYGIDGLSAMATVAAIAQLMPAFATLLSIIWGLIRIWETKTVQEWFGRGAVPFIEPPIGLPELSSTVTVQESRISTLAGDEEKPNG